MQKQKGFILPIVIAVVVVAILGAGGYFVYKQYSAPKPIACTEEAKVCPDGSSVGRIGPNCEFAECPAVVDETAGWKTYINKQSDYTFNLKIPIRWFVEENAAYANDDVKNLIKNCRGGACEVGRLRFKSYNYPENFLALGWMPKDAPNGAILDIYVTYSLDSLNNSGNQDVNPSLLFKRDGLQGDKNYQESLLNLYSIYHNGLEYRFMPIIYIKNGTAESEKERLKTEFLPIFDQILSTFKFTK